MAADPTPLAVIKIFCYQPQNEYARCVAYVSRQIRSRRLKHIVEINLENMEIPQVNCTFIQF